MENSQIKVCTKKKLQAVQSKSSAVLTSGDENKVTKVLAVAAFPHVEGSEVANAEAKTNVTVRFDALVVYENGFLGALSATSTVKITSENAAIKIGNTVEFNATVLDQNTHISNGEVVCSALINLDVFLSDRDLSIKSIEADEDIFTKESDIELNSFKSNVTHSSRAIYEESKDSKLKTILQSSHSGIIKNVSAMNDYFVVSGEIVFNLIYECEDGQIKSFIKQTSFNEEVECAGITKENIVQANLIVNTPCVARITNEGSGTLNFEMPFMINANIYERTNRECIIDAYHLEKEVNLTTESFEQNIFVQSLSAEESIIASFTVGEDKPKPEKILAVSAGNISLVNSFVKEREVVLEGIANVNTVYYSEDDDGNKILNSLLVDLPYSLTLPCSDAQSGDNIEAFIVLGDISVKNRKGKELEVIASIKVSYNLSRTVVSAIATGITYGEVKSQKDYALEIYVARDNQTIWDIAKQLNVSTDDILTQNPTITLPVSMGDKIVCYRKRQLRF